MVNNCRASLTAKAHLIYKKFGSDISTDDNNTCNSLDPQAVLSQNDYLVSCPNTDHHYQRPVDLVLIDMRSIKTLSLPLIAEARLLKQNYPNAAMLFLLPLTLPYTLRQPLRRIGLVLAMGENLDPLIRRVKAIIADLNLADECSLRMKSFEKVTSATTDDFRKPLTPPQIPASDVALRVLIAGSPCPASLDAMQILGTEGFETLAALTAPQTLRYLESKRFDCLVFIPGPKNATFISLLKLLRRHDVGKKLPIIVLTEKGRTPLSVGEKFLVHGADMSLTTDDITDALVTEVSALAKKSRLAEALQVFLKDSIKCVSSNFMGIADLSYFEEHIKANAVVSDLNCKPFTIGAFRLALVPEGFSKAEIKSSNTFDQAMVYAAMVTRDCDLITRASDDMFLIAFPATTEKEADIVREHIVGVLNDLKLHADDAQSGFETLTVHSAVASHRLGDSPEQTIAAAIKGMKIIFGRKRPSPARVLTVVK